MRPIKSSGLKVKLTKSQKWEETKKRNARNKRRVQMGFKLRGTGTGLPYVRPKSHRQPTLTTTIRNEKGYKAYLESKQFQPQHNR